MSGNRALGYLLKHHWAMTEEALRTMVTIALRENLSPEAIAAARGEPLDNTRRVTLRNGIATIPIRGPLFRYANLFTAISGGTSMEVLATDLMEAATSPDVRAILLETDSPGGEVNGTQELGELLYEIRGAKPIVAHVGGDGNSAGYWLASAASEVVAGETAILGSIGVRAAFLDTTEADRKAGVREIVIVSSQSPRKDIDPATPEGEADIRAILDDLAEVFVATVARNRGVDRATVLRDFGQGGVLVGARAVAAGLADRVLTFEALHAELEAKHAGARVTTLLPRSATGSGTLSTTPVPSRSQEQPMPSSDPTTPTPLTAEQLVAQYPDAVAAFRAEGATAERERLFGIDALAKPGLGELLTACKQDPACTPADAALRIVQHEQKQAKGHLARLEASEQAEPKPPAAPAPDDDPSPEQAAAKSLLATYQTMQSERTGRNA